MTLRSLLFVPADRPERFAKAVASGADAIILDLEDSVALISKAAAREAVVNFLAEPRTAKVFVRVNGLRSGLIDDDLSAVRQGRPDGVVLPKAVGATDVNTLRGMMGEYPVPVLPVATENPAGVFALGSFADCQAALGGLTWGAEDLPAAIGASTAREADGRFTPPYEMVRSLALFAAHNAQVPAIETVYPDIADEAGLIAFAERARRDGFTAMMAIHPKQVAKINAAFTPTPDEIEHAKKLVSLFESAPELGVAMLDGKMVDRPHLISAKSILSRVSQH